jgi:hypothetical protein
VPREVGRLAHDATLLPLAGDDQIADHDRSSADADADPKRLRRLELLGTANQSQAGPYRLRGVVLVRPRVAEVHQHPIAHVLGDEALEAGDRLGDAAMIDADDLTQVLGIQARRERRRADEIAEEHGELPAFGITFGLCLGPRRLRFRRNGAGKLYNRRQQLPSMS